MGNIGSIEPLNRVNLADEIFNRIVDFIRDGHLEADEKLMSEREFCDLFQASRTSVREALKGLTAIGIIVKRRDGNYVCKNMTDIIAKPINILLKSNDLNLDEVFEARFTVEIQIARIAAEKASAEEIRALEECLDIGGQTSSEDVMHKAMAFHMMIAECTHNHILQEMYAVIYRILQEMRNNKQSLRQVHHSQNLHRNILDAIRKHDPDEAEKATRHHLSVLYNAISETKPDTD